MDFNLQRNFGFCCRAENHISVPTIFSFMIFNWQIGNATLSLTPSEANDERKERKTNEKKKQKLLEIMCNDLCKKWAQNRKRGKNKKLKRIERQSDPTNARKILSTCAKNECAIEWKNVSEMKKDRKEKSKIRKKKRKWKKVWEEEAAAEKQWDEWKSEL